METAVETAKAAVHFNETVVLSVSEIGLKLK